MRDGPASSNRKEKVPPRLYVVMAVTTRATFGTLVTSYQLLFPGPSFA
jgi:hypothetical protein